MKKIIIIVISVLILLICGILIFNSKIEVEYVPETEIADSDMRKTMVTLFFQNKNDKTLQKETRLIDSKDLLLDPYKELINMLIAGPESDSLEKIIPEGTVILNVSLDGECLKVDFSKEFKENITEELKQNVLDSLVNTLTQLTEVNSVKICVEGQEI